MQRGREALRGGAGGGGRCGPARPGRPSGLCLSGASSGRGGVTGEPRPGRAPPAAERGRRERAGGAGQAGSCSPGERRIPAAGRGTGTAGPGLRAWLPPPPPWGSRASSAGSPGCALAALGSRWEAGGCLYPMASHRSHRPGRCLRLPLSCVGWARHRGAPCKPCTVHAGPPGCQPCLQVC